MTDTAVSLVEDRAMTAPTPTDSILSVIERAARDPGVDVGKMQALLDMHERMAARAAEIEFNRALANLPAFRVKKNGRINLIRKDGSASGSIPFARWEDMAAVIEPRLAAEGFRLTFDSTPRQGDGGGLLVTGTLLHKNGHSRSATLPLPLDTGPGRNNLQAYGSTLSYGKRYTTEMLLNIVREGEDNDGAGADDGGTITPEQADEIFSLVQRTNTDQTKFLDWLGINAIDQIPAADYARAVNALQKRIRA